MSSLVIGSVVGGVEKNRLEKCSFANQVAVCYGLPFCLCSLGGGVCSHNGKRAKFRFRFGDFYVVSVCEKLDGLPDLEK